MRIGVPCFGAGFENLVTNRFAATARGKTYRVDANYLAFLGEEMVPWGENYRF